MKSFKSICVSVCILLAVATSSFGKNKERWQYFDQGLFPDVEITAIARDSLQNYWFGTREGLVSMSPSENFETHTLESTGGGLVGNTITDLAVDEIGDLWVATNKGVSVFSNGAWQSYTNESTNGGLPHDHVLSMSIDKKDNKWFGTKEGFATLSRSIWTTYSVDKIAGLIPDPNIYAIYPVSDDKIWLGTVKGVYLFNGTSYRHFNHKNTNGGLPNNYITQLSENSDGVLWVGTQNGFSKFNGKDWEALTSKTHKEIPGDMVYDLVVKNGQVWASMRGGAVWLNDGVWKPFTKSNTDFGLTSKRVLSILPGENGEIWFGTREGLCKMSPIP